MFKVTKNPTFVRDVTVVFPAAEGTGETKGVIEVTYNRIGEKAYKEASREGDNVLARALVAKVGKVGDENGNLLPPDEALEAVLDDSAAVTAIVANYTKEIRLKNLSAKN